MYDSVIVCVGVCSHLNTTDTRIQNLHSPLESSRAPLPSQFHCSDLQCHQQFSLSLSLLKMKSYFFFRLASFDHYQFLRFIHVVTYSNSFLILFFFIAPQYYNIVYGYSVLFLSTVLMNDIWVMRGDPKSLEVGPLEVQVSQLSDYSRKPSVLMYQLVL